MTDYLSEAFIHSTNENSNRSLSILLFPFSIRGVIHARCEIRLKTFETLYNRHTRCNLDSS